MSDYTPLQRLAIGQYLAKRLDKELKRGTGGLRDAVDMQAIEEYGANDSDRWAVIINGQKVGSLSLSVDEAKPQRTQEVVRVTDRAAFVDWMQSNPEAVAAWVADTPDAADAFAGWALVALGEQVAGTGYVTELAEPARPAKVRTVLRVKDEAMQAALPELSTGVLGQLGAGNGD